MGYSFRALSVPELERRWRRLRGKVVSGKAVQEDLDRLLAIRKEIDRRRGGDVPASEVDFESYLTD